MILVEYSIKFMLVYDILQIFNICRILQIKSNLYVYYN